MYIDLNYVMHQKLRTIESVVRRYKASFHYLTYLKQYREVTAIIHLPNEECARIDGVSYQSFAGSNRFFHIPFKTHRYIKHLNPEVVLVQGFVFPLQTIFLRKQLGKKVAIIIQHHGEKPFVNPVKRWLQKQACKLADGFFFTAIGNAQPWMEQRLIGHNSTCYEVLEASTTFTRQDVGESREKTGIRGNGNFLWVGRLNANKDPLTVLRAFAQYAQESEDARLCMIYQSEELLQEVKALLNSNNSLEKRVKLVGKVAHEDLPYWYSAADFYITASHSEGSGYALIEAMACGCIPIVTAIPSFTAIIGQGGRDWQYPVGKVSSLTDILRKTRNVNRQEMSDNIIRHFQQHLSFQAIARTIDAHVKKIIAAKQS